MGQLMRELYAGEPLDCVTPDARWFAIEVRPQHEHAAAAALRQKGLEAFDPTYTITRRWSDRVKKLTVPLFPGYLFCRCPPALRTTALRTPGVYSIVGFGTGPIAISDDEIARVRLMIDSKLAFQPWPFLRTGDPVLVHDGPLRGLEGILVRAPNKWRVVVGLTVLQRSVAVTVDREMICPAGPSDAISRHDFS